MAMRDIERDRQRDRERERERVRVVLQLSLSSKLLRAKGQKNLVSCFCTLDSAVRFIRVSKLCTRTGAGRKGLT